MEKQYVDMIERGYKTLSIGSGRRWTRWANSDASRLERIEAYIGPKKVRTECYWRVEGDTMIAAEKINVTKEFTKTEFAVFCRDQEIVFSERRSLKSLESGK